MLGPQGRHGEVAVELFTSFPERFGQRRRVFALDENGARRELHIDDFWPHKRAMVLKFAGIDSISDAETLARCEIQVPAAERAPLEEGAQYVSDLVGCHVLVVTQRAAPPAEGGSERGFRDIGAVDDVDFSAGEAPLLVIRAEGREHLVPFAGEFIVRIDVAAKRIEMRLPEGLLELDAPLSREEKEEQQRNND